MAPEGEVVGDLEPFQLDGILARGSAWAWPARLPFLQQAAEAFCTQFEEGPHSAGFLPGLCDDGLAALPATPFQGRGWKQPQQTPEGGLCHGMRRGSPHGRRREILGCGANALRVSSSKAHFLSVLSSQSRSRRCSSLPPTDEGWAGGLGRLQTSGQPRGVSARHRGVGAFQGSPPGAFSPDAMMALWAWVLP